MRDRFHNSHWSRRAVIGSTEDARRNGTRHARHAVPSSTRTATATTPGSLELPSTQLFISRVIPRLSDSPTTTPDTTPILASLSTFLSTSLLFAPSAIRIANSLVRWATEKETTLYKPMDDNANARPAEIAKRIETSRARPHSGWSWIHVSILSVLP